MSRDGSPKRDSKSKSSSSPERLPLSQHDYFPWVFLVKRGCEADVNPDGEVDKIFSSKEEAEQYIIRETVKTPLTGWTKVTPTLWTSGDWTFEIEEWYVNKKAENSKMQKEPDTLETLIAIAQSNKDEVLKKLYEEYLDIGIQEELKDASLIDQINFLHGLPILVSGTVCQSPSPTISDDLWKLLMILFVDH